MIMLSLRRFVKFEFTSIRATTNSSGEGAGGFVHKGVRRSLLSTSLQFTRASLKFVSRAPQTSSATSLCLIHQELSEKTR